MNRAGCWIAVALTMSVLGTAYRVEAKQPPRVLMLPYQLLGEGLPPDLGAETTAVVANEAAQGPLAIIQPERSGPQVAPHRDQPTGDPKAGPRAIRLIEQARTALDDGDFAEAAQTLKTAITRLEKNGDALDDLQPLADAYLLAGVAFFRDGQEDEGDDMLARAVHYAPERKLKPGEMPPIFMRVFERARTNVLQRPRARIEVRAPPASTVRLDGRAVGNAPLVLTDVLPGKHWLRVQSPGRGVQVKTLKVRSRKTLVVEFGGGAAASSAPAAASNRLSPADIKALQAQAAKARCSFVMLGAIHKSSTAYLVRTVLLDAKSGRVGRLTDIAFDLDMLTAEIEVFKLAEDLRKQIESGVLATPIEGGRVTIAADFRVKPVTASSAVRTVAAAPPAPAAMPMPKPVARRAPPPPPKAAAARTPSGRTVVTTGSTLIPKDELEDNDDDRIKPVSLAQRIDDKDDDGDLTWLWITLGVVAAGAAGTGAYFLATSGSPDEGSLNIRW